MNVEPWLSRAARIHPARAAIETPSQRLTYRELEGRAAAVAAALVDRGAGPGRRVALALPAGPDFASALHAAWRLGATVVPVDVRLGAAERAVLTAGVDVIVDSPIDAPAHPRSDPPREHRCDEPALIIHTSGSTGQPRPVTLTYANLLWSAVGSAVALGLDPHERWLCTLPVSHVGGLSILIRSALYATTAVVHERFDEAAVLAELASPGGATLVSLVPTTLARLLDAGLGEPARLRCALIGGGPVAPALLARARAVGVPISQTYGLTEACSQVTTAPPVDRKTDPVCDAGPPLFCTRVQIAHDGEILVAGPTVAPAAVSEDGWLHTGDLGHLDDTGRLTVTGRMADTIITGGENVAPAEIEGILLEHPAVADAAVHAVPDERWGEAVVAAIVLRAGMRADERELLALCSSRLVGYKVPKQVRFVVGLPRTPSGKLRRRELAGMSGGDLGGDADERG